MSKRNKKKNKNAATSGKVAAVETTKAAPSPSDTADASAPTTAVAAAQEAPDGDGDQDAPVRAPLIGHKHKVDDPDEFELRLHRLYEWSRDNANLIVVGVAVLIAVIGWVLYQQDVTAKKRQNGWNEFQQLAAAAQSAGNPDTLATVLRQYQSLPSHPVMALTYAGMVVNKKGVDAKEAEDVLARLSATHEATPTREIATRFLESLRREREQRSRFLAGLKPEADSSKVGSGN